MMKQFYKRIVTGLAFLLILAASLGMLTMAQADTTDSYALSIDYDPSFCTVKITYGGNTVVMADGETHYIPKNNAEITIKVEPMSAGYKVDSMVSKIDSRKYVLTNNAHTTTLTSDDELLVTCSAKTFEIEYCTDEGYSYQMPADGFFPDEYTFGTETKLSVPELGGYTFEYWLLLPSKNADESTAQMLQPDKNGLAMISTTVPVDGETLFLKPKWKPIEYEVYRVDYVYSTLVGDHRGDLLSKANEIAMWMAPMGSTVNGNMGEERHYPGYHYPATPDYYSADVKVTLSLPSEKTNTVYRFYLPNEYALEFLSGHDGDITFAEGVERPTAHVFNANTAIPDPVRVGYVFTGWTVTVTKNGSAASVTRGAGLTLDAANEAWAGDKDTKITLTANWKADEYRITLDKNVGGEDDVSVHTEKYVYDKGVTIPDPVRSGYTFLGWCINGGTTPQSGTLAPFVYSGDISMVAQWKANDYTVTFNGNGATVAGLGSLTATFDSPVNSDALKSALPAREGHELCGFTLTPNGEDLVFDAEGNYLGTVWDIPADTTVYAKWNVLSYEVAVNAVNAKIFLNDVEYTGAPMLFEFGTTVRVRIEANAGFKVTSWEGEIVTHTKVFTFDYTVPAAKSVLDASVLRIITTPAFTVDYVGEVFRPDSAIADGTYRIVCGGETLLITVQNGSFTVNEERVTEIAIPESFFGKQIEIMMFGDNQTTADSDPQTVTLAARPALPVLNNQIEVITELDRTISIKLFPSLYKYEFALSVKSDGVGLVWRSESDMVLAGDGAYVFDDLNPGTIYYVYIRVQAAEGEHPHGEVNIFEKKTYVGNYLNEKIDALEKLKDTYGDGEMVDALIRDAIEQAKALVKPSATFYNDLEGIYNRVLSEIAFAKAQDDRIAELRALRDSMLATKTFNTEGENRITTLCADAIASIKAAQTPDEITSVYNTQSAAMRAVKLTYLQSADMKLTSLAGLPQGTRLSGLRLDELASLIETIDRAIKSGSISVAEGNQMLLADAVASLRSLDVMAAYTAKLTLNDSVFTDYDGLYEIRLTLPENLRHVSGLQVACYNAKTGVLEVLDTERDGNDLVFLTPYVTDFVILGDPTVELVGVIAALGVILLCQLIGIVLLIVRRSGHAKEVRSHAFALPTLLLTIRFFPENAPLLVAILGGLAIVFQIILIYLLLSSEVFLRRKRRHRAAYEEPARTAEPAEAEATYALPVEEPAAEPTADDEDTLLAMSYFGKEAVSTDEDSEDTYPEDEEIDVDAYERNGETADESEDGDYDDGYGFIEPAPDPRYSLPDEASFAEHDEDPDGDYVEETVEEETVEEETVEEDSTWDYDDGAEDADGESEAYATDADTDLDEPAFEAADEDDLIEAVVEEVVDEDEAFYDENADAEPAFADADALFEGEEDGAYYAIPEESYEETDEADGEDALSNGDGADDEMSDGDSDDGEDPNGESDGDEEDDFFFEPDACGDDAPPPEYFDDANGKRNS